MSRRRTPHLDQALLHQSLDPGLQLLQDLGGPLSGPLSLLFPLVLQFSLVVSLLQERHLTAGLTKTLLQTPNIKLVPSQLEQESELLLDFRSTVLAHLISFYSDKTLQRFTFSSSTSFAA